MKIQNFVVSFIFLLSATTYAAEAVQKFASKDVCFKNFASTTGNSSLGAAEIFCKDKYVILKSPVDVCADKKLLDFKMKNSISSLDEPKYMIKFKNECIKLAQADAQQQQEAVQQYQQQTQLAQQQAQIVAQQRAAQQAANDAKKRQDSQASLQQTGQLLQAVTPIVGQAEAAYRRDPTGEPKTVKRVDPAASTGAPTTPVANAPASTTSSQSNGSKEIAGANTPSTQVEPSTAAPLEADPNKIGYTNDEGQPPSPEEAKSAQEKMNTEQLEREKEKIYADTKKSQDALDQQLNPVKKDIPGVEKEVDAIGSASKTITDFLETDITVTSEATTQKLTALYQTSVNKLGAIYRVNMVASAEHPFVLTQQSIELVQEIAEKYAVGGKSVCTKFTEGTELLCLERSSPGWIAAKTLVNVASPILAIVNSTQKTCSNTSKITGLAGTALTVAKGACMTAQLSCLATCKMAQFNLQSAITALVTKTEAALQSEMGAAIVACTAKGTPIVALGLPCHAEINNKFLATKAALTEIQLATKTELAPTPGTAAGLSAKCNMKITDALIMGANIASLVIAKKSADECDRKLAAAGAAGANVSQTQYCETPANVATQFCKCQKNSNQMGCPGYNASNDDLNKKDLAGTNLKGAGGVSAFAGSGNSKTNFSGNGGLVGGNLKADGSAVQASGGGSSEGGQATGSGAFGGGAGSDRASGFGSGASDAANNGTEKKKWSFGSFANSVGNLFGGRGSKNSGTNGGLSSKQESAIQRKIASDKLADEVTSASGKSNWEKVHRLYSIKENTLMSGK